MPAFSLVCSPALLTVYLLPTHNAPLPILTNPTASVPDLSPGNLRRKVSRPVSYYALFKCMAASKPTSWLSVKPHILYHLIWI